MKDYPISQLMIVKVFHKKQDDNAHEDAHVYYMHKSQLETFIAAQVKLHYSPGINPYNGVQTATLWEIKAIGLQLDTVSYWWCHPNLALNHSKEGAQLNPDDWSIFYNSDRKWAHPDLIELEKVERERALMDEWMEDRYEPA